MPRSKEQFEEIRKKTRGNILENALKLFADKGYHGTSMSDIAKAADVSKGLAYNYFESKQKLIEALFGSFEELGIEMMRRMASAKDPYEKLKLMVEYSFELMIDNEEYWRLYIAFVLQPGIFESGKESINKATKEIIMEIMKIFDEIGVKNSEAEARIFGATFDGLWLQYLYDKENFDFEAVKKQFLNKYSKEELERLK